jgi:hypothetical protein
MRIMIGWSGGLCSSMLAGLITPAFAGGFTITTWCRKRKPRPLSWVERAMCHYRH